MLLFPESTLLLSLESSAVSEVLVADTTAAAFFLARVSNRFTVAALRFAGVQGETMKARRRLT